MLEISERTDRDRFGPKRICTNGPWICRPKLSHLNPVAVLQSRERIADNNQRLFFSIEILDHMIARGGQVSEFLDEA